MLRNTSTQDVAGQGRSELNLQDIRVAWTVGSVWVGVRKASLLKGSPRMQTLTRRKNDIKKGEEEELQPTNYILLAEKDKEEEEEEEEELQPTKLLTITTTTTSGM